jgi:hypothetical protein
MTSEWKTLYQSLSGKSYSSKNRTVLKKAVDARTQKAVLGLIMHHAQLQGENPSESNLPYGMKKVAKGVELNEDQIPREVMLKINQLVTK